MGICNNINHKRLNPKSHVEADSSHTTKKIQKGI